tara:strand:+ start:1549 stop:1686 length:138 start_codon:yes stop_codon:yes gene_type:complete
MKPLPLVVTERSVTLFKHSDKLSAGANGGKLELLDELDEVPAESD